MTPQKYVKKKKKKRDDMPIFAHCIANNILISNNHLNL